MPASKKKVIKHVENLPVPELHVDYKETLVAGGTSVFEVAEGSSYKETAEHREKLFVAIHEANKKLLQSMLIRSDEVLVDIRGRLRTAAEATDLLRDAEILMYNLEEHISRHRYTLPESYGEYSYRNANFYQLALINQKIVEGRYPYQADGRAAVLTPMQLAVLWH